MSFITLSREQFEAILPKDFSIVDDSKSKEIIYQFKTENKSIDVRLYSTVDIYAGQTRDIGKDAIRIIFWDNKNNKPIGKGKKILRVEGATTIEQRILQRIMEFLKDARNKSVTNYDYVRSILEHDAIYWMDFASSLLDNLDTYGKLTENQLAYIIGEKNPKGKPTFEARVKEKDPDFFFEGEQEDGQDIQTGQGSIDVPERQDQTDKKKDQKEQSQIEEIVPTRTTIPIGTIPGYDGRLIPTSEYLDWQYPFAEFNPVQSEVLPHREEDANMIIGANTSAGKTCACELIIDWIMGNGV